MSGSGDLCDGSEITLGREPDEWVLARVTRSVAGVVERRGWDVETARELLEMLGVDDNSAVKKARSGLRASRIERRGIGYTQRQSGHRAFHLREQPMPEPDVEVTIEPAVELDNPVASSTGLEVGTQWARAVVVGVDAVLTPPTDRLIPLDEVLARVGLTRAHLAPDVKMCKKGLHALDGDNVIHRPDRTTLACRSCENARKRKAREFNAQLRARYKAEQGG
jgi:hypothetical protein